MKSLYSAVIATVALFAIGPATADEAAVRGEKVVDQWCRLCHLRAADPPNPDMAPPYEEIVKRPGRDEPHFVEFLQEDHFPMTIYRLFDTRSAMWSPTFCRSNGTDPRPS